MTENSKQKIKTILWFFLVIIVGILFASFIFRNASYRKIVTPEENIALAIQTQTEDKKEENFYFLKNSNQKPKVNAKAYLVGDLDTGEIILSKEKDTPYPIASVSKIMTAYVAQELMSENDTAKVSKRALNTYGENGNFKLGEKIKINELLYPLLLESSNDAAEIIAEYFSRENFIKKMNQVGKIIELSKTSFNDPSGLSEKNISTVFDIFKLASYIKQENPNLFEITTKKDYSTSRHNWSSNNQFLSEGGYIGGKSGYTDPALQTVISLFKVPLSEKGTRNIAITLLQSRDRYKDVENILKYLNKNVYYGGQQDANESWVKQKDGIPEIKDPDFVTLFFGGDIMLDRGVRNSVNKNFNGNYSKLFEKLGIIKKSDIAFANLEGPASDMGADLKNLYSFRMDPSVIPALKGAGFSIISVANNHVGDWGREAYGDTLRRLKENEIFYTGGGINTEEAEKPVIIEKYGIKIGYLGFSDVGPEWMKSKDDQPGILLANNPKFSEIIQNAAKQVDHLVVSFHFGDEYKTIHNGRQEYLAHKAIDAGAKIVVGHHPHVIQDTEIYKNGYIIYSLGNFIFDQRFSENTMKGMLLEMKLNKEGEMIIKKNTVHLNNFFQPEKITLGKEEKIKLKEITSQ